VHALRCLAFATVEGRPLPTRAELSDPDAFARVERDMTFVGIGMGVWGDIAFSACSGSPRSVAHLGATPWTHACPTDTLHHRQSLVGKNSSRADYDVNSHRSPQKSVGRSWDRGPSRQFFLLSMIAHCRSMPWGQSAELPGRRSEQGDINFIKIAPFSFCSCDARPAAPGCLTGAGQVPHSGHPCDRHHRRQ